MRPTIAIALSAAVLLCTSCGRSSSGTEAGAAAETNTPAVETPAQDSLRCADLSGKTFTITYYLNNAPQGTDVWHFEGDSVRSEMYEKEGYGYLKGGCRQRTATSVEGRGRTFKDKSFISANYTVVNGGIDGVFNKGTKGSREQETVTFSGKMQ